jgi:tRNA A37 N6-isopentenylltransferase MiaA
MALFKKQQTWFKRNEDVVWVDNAHEVADEVIRYMARWQV